MLVIRYAVTQIKDLNDLIWSFVIITWFHYVIIGHRRTPLYHPSDMFIHSSIVIQVDAYMLHLEGVSKYFYFISSHLSFHSNNTLWPHYSTTITVQTTTVVPVPFFVLLCTLIVLLFPIDAFLFTSRCDSTSCTVAPFSVRIIPDNHHSHFWKPPSSLIVLVTVQQLLYVWHTQWRNQSRLAIRDRWQMILKSRAQEEAIGRESLTESMRTLLF